MGGSSLLRTEFWTSSAFHSQLLMQFYCYMNAQLNTIGCNVNHTCCKYCQNRRLWNRYCVCVRYNHDVGRYAFIWCEQYSTVFAVQIQTRSGIPINRYIQLAARVKRAVLRRVVNEAPKFDSSVVRTININCIRRIGRDDGQSFTIYHCNININLCTFVAQKTSIERFITVNSLVHFDPPPSV